MCCSKKINNGVMWCGTVWSGVTSYNCYKCFIPLIPQQIPNNYIYYLLKKMYLFFTILNASISLYECKTYYLYLSKGQMGEKRFIKFSFGFRAEPLLARIKADRRVVLSPVFDRVDFDTLEVTLYFANAHAFDWQLWCMYESFRPDWYELKDPSIPGKWVIPILFTIK